MLWISSFVQLLRTLVAWAAYWRAEETDDGGCENGGGTGLSTAVTKYLTDVFEADKDLECRTLLSRVHVLLILRK